MKHGAGYSGGGKKNNSGGATQPKTGKQYVPLCRQSGYDQALTAVENKTRSQYPHTAKHYHYESTGFFGDNEEVVGYRPE